VKRVAKSLRLPLVVGRGEVRRKAKLGGISIEMAARDARHHFLAATARKRGIKTIALAHHADDQIELFFVRLLRGAGSRGLGGMSWSNKSPVDQRTTLIRPLLDCRKEELVEFARDERIRYREDASNESMGFFRNRIRHELLPLLRQRYQPALDGVVARQMEMLSAESEMLEKLAEDWRRTRSPRFEALAIALQRIVLQQELIALGAAVDFEAIEKLRMRSGQAVSVSNKVTVVHDGFGAVHRTAPSSRDFVDGCYNFSFEGDAGQGSFGGVDWEWRIRDGKTKLPKFASGVEWFDAEKVGSAVRLRHWQPGDRFQPSGMDHAVKLQDLFTNLKIPVDRRRRLLVAAKAGGEIWWVEGLRIAEQFKLSANTRKRLWWRWRRKN